MAVSLTLEEEGAEGITAAGMTALSYAQAKVCTHCTRG